MIKKKGREHEGGCPSASAADGRQAEAGRHAVSSSFVRNVRDASEQSMRLWGVFGARRVGRGATLRDGRHQGACMGAAKRYVWRAPR